MLDELKFAALASSAVVVACGLLFWAIAGAAAASRRGRSAWLGVLVGGALPVLGVGVLLCLPGRGGGPGQGSGRAPLAGAAGPPVALPTPSPQALPAAGTAPGGLPGQGARTGYGLARPGAPAVVGVGPSGSTGGPVGGPFAGGPPAGGPYAGGPFAGSPFAGAPLAGGPFAGGPFAGAPSAGGLAAPLPGAVAAQWARSPGVPVVPATGSALAPARAAGRAALTRLPRRPGSVAVPAEPPAVATGSRGSWPTARPADVALLAAAALAVVLMLVAGTEPLVNVRVRGLGSESLGLDDAPPAAAALLAGVVVLAAAAVLQLIRPRGTWPVLGAAVTVSCLLVGVEAALVTDAVGDLLRTVAGGRAAPHGSVTQASGTPVLIAAGVVGTAWSGGALALLHCRRCAARRAADGGGA